MYNKPAISSQMDLEGSLMRKGKGKGGRGSGRGKGKGKGSKR